MNRRRRAVVLALVLAGSLWISGTAPIAHAAGCPAASFDAAHNFGVDTLPSAVAVGDFNGDGALDLATANFVAGTMSVLLNTTAPGAAPSFAAAQSFAAGLDPIAIAAGDFNRDGKVDIVLVQQSNPDVLVYLNTTAPGAVAPSFTAGQSVAVGGKPTSVAVGDLNLDGIVDLTVTDRAANRAAVLLSATAPGAIAVSFAAAQSFSVGSRPSAVAMSDLNGDGRLDLAVANDQSANLSVLLNTTISGAPVPSFAAAQSFPTALNPFSVAIADFDGDGKPDLAVANRDSHVSVLLNRTAPGAPAPGFTPAATFIAGSTPFSVAAGDVNGDGRPDLAVANFPTTPSVMLNTTAPGAAAPSFTAAQSLPGSGGPTAVTLSDVNRDGRLDLVATNGNTNDVSVFPNTCASGCPMPEFAAASGFGIGAASQPIAIASADFNADGRVDIAVANFLTDNVSVLLNTTAPGAPAPSFAAAANFPAEQDPYAIAAGDLNGDGKPDLAVTNAISVGTVSVLLNMTAPGAAAPSFAALQSFSVGGDPDGVAIDDVNLDGKPDLAVANAFGNVSVLLNATAPGAFVASFSAQFNFPAGTLPRAIGIADLNGDGRPDLAVANSLSDDVSILLNTTLPGAAAPSFGATVSFAAGPTPVAITLGDLNGDGRPDVTVSNEGLNVDTVTVLLDTTAPGDVAPSLGAPQSFGVGAAPYSVAVGDVDADGEPDLVAANAGSDSVSALHNTTAPGAMNLSFAPAANFATGSGPFSLAMQDFNGDGARDLATADSGADTVSVLFNLGCTPCAIVCPDDVYAGVANGVQGSTFGRIVTYAAPTTTGGCLGAPTCSPASGSFFPTGTTTVTCTAVDPAGPPAMCSFAVTVDSPFGICVVDDATGDTFGEVVDASSPLYRYWRYRVAATGADIVGRANSLSYVPSRSLTSYDNDYSSENPTHYMNANVSYGTNTATVVVRRPNGRDGHTLRDRNIRNDPPCS